MGTIADLMAQTLADAGFVKATVHPTDLAAIGHLPFAI